MKYRFLARHITFCALIFSAFAATGRTNDKALNRPYADLKAVHFGFSVGMTMQNLRITNNGYTTETGEQWIADVPAISPGFTVSVLADMRLGDYFNFRVSPGMQFANKVVKFYDANEVSEMQSQNIRSTYVLLPLEIKYSGLRYKNFRPYLIGGVMGVLDVGKRRSEQLMLNQLDCMLTVGIGLDFYLPFFKLCPELKFCFGLLNVLKKNRPDLDDNPVMMNFTRSVDKIANNMVVLTFYFE